MEVVWILFPASKSCVDGTNDIGCLSSLEYLDLSGNNFFSLPESMFQLSNLRKLYLEGCKSLQSLENVLSTIDSVIADDCTSLERLPKLQFYLFRSNRTYLQFLFFNCFKLVDNNMLQGINNMLQVGLSVSMSLSPSSKHYALYILGTKWYSTKEVKNYYSRKWNFKIF